MLKKHLPKIIVLAGPTATGKTALGIKIAKKVDGEIVSADSRQVYKGMDIGTGKPEISNLKSQISKVCGIRHYLFNVVDPDEEFTVALWKQQALAAIKDILKRKKLPIVVGGTGLYIKSLVENLDIPQVPPDFKLRKKLELRIKKQGLEVLYKELLKLDPRAKGVVDSKNPRRVIRALEVCLKTGKLFTAQYTAGQRLFDVLEIGISMPRSKLYENIDKRVDEMVEQGLVVETRKLLRKYSHQLPAMSGIGYLEIGEYLSGKIGLAEAVSKIKYRTHAYARRQLTWFRKNKKIKWVMTQKQAETMIKRFLTSAKI